MKRAWGLSLIGSCVLTAAASHAAAAPESLLELSLEELMRLPVVTATRHTEPLDHVAGTVLVITQQDIRRRGYHHLFDLLRDLPGIDVQGYSNATFYNRVTVRGLTGNNKFLILQDGFRISAPAGEPVAIAFNYPLHHVHQVEIVYGPASAVYGADAVSAVINLISEDRASGRQLLLEQGEDGQTQWVHVNEQADPWQWSVSAHGQQDNGADLASAYPERLPIGDLLNLDGSLQIPANARRPYDNRSESRSLGARLLHEGGLELGVWQRQLRHPTTAGDRSDLTEYGGFWSYSQHNVWGRMAWPAERGELQATLDYSDYELDNQSHFLNAITGYRPGYHYAYSDRLHGELQWSRSLGAADHLVAGLSAERVHATPKTTDLDRPYDRAAGPDTQDLHYLGTDNRLPIVLFHVAHGSQGLFVQHQREWSPQWQTLAGLRYDQSDLYAGQWMPRASISFLPSARWRWHAAYAEAFLAPSPYFIWENYGSFNGTQDSQGRYVSEFMHVPNPALQPETVATMEAGGRWQASDDLQLFATAYHSELEDLIGLVPMAEAASDFVPGGVILRSTQNANVGRLQVNGLDVWVRHQQGLARYGALANWFALSWTNGHLSSPSGQQALPYVAARKLKAGVSWSLNDHLFLTLNMLASAHVPALQSASRPDPVSAPGYVVTHLHGGWNNVITGLDLLVSIENLFDTRYYNAGDNLDTTLVASPQNPRRWTLGLRFRF